MPFACWNIIVAHRLLLEEPVEFGDFFKGFEKFGAFLEAGLDSIFFWELYFASYQEFIWE
jgi:hypothetical protein